MIKTNFFTAANGKYELFIPIYSFSVLLNNPDATVEIVVEDDEAIKRLQSIRDCINEIFDDRLLIRKGDFSRTTPNIVRFLETPQQNYEYTYIGDIDIVIAEHITPWHEKKMNELQLPHSNIIRKNEKRLTGLHFCKTNSHYPIDISEFNVFARESTTDEKFLYHLYQNRNQLPPESHTSRPLHGLHISLNRCPYDKKGWGMNPIFFEKTIQTFTSDHWKSIEGKISARSIWMVDLLLLSIRAKSIFSIEEINSIRPLCRPAKEQTILDEFYKK